MHFYHACQGKSVGSYQVGAYNLISMSKIRSLGLQCKISSICVKIQLPFLANILYFALVSKFRTFLLGGVQKRNTIGATPMLGPSHGSKEQQPLDTQGLGHKNRSKELFIHNTTFIWVRVWLEKEKKKERKRRNWWCCSVFFLQLMGTLWKMKLLYVGVPHLNTKERGFDSEPDFAMEEQLSLGWGRRRSVPQGWINTQNTAFIPHVYVDDDSAEEGAILELKWNPLLIVVYW